MDDLEQFRRRKKRESGKPAINLAQLLAVAGATIAVLSAAVWLVRDTRDVVTSLGPAEGSLVINLNTASEHELISVPGIGPTRAAQVIAGRPYASVDELEKIAGIAGKTLESLRPFVSVDGETRPRD
jgi:competence protein ComEA